MYSSEFLDDELNNIETILKLNGDPERLVERIIQSQLTRLNKAKPYGPERCQTLLKLLNVGSESKLFEKKLLT